MHIAPCGWLRTLVSSTVVAILSAACGSDPVPENATTPTPTFTPRTTAAVPPEAAPQWCGPGPQPATQTVGGTPECPDDKNLEGCPCPTVGAKAPCWPGLRYHRGHGVCKDGVTECIGTGELGRSWGKCEGAVLPTPGVKSGNAACTCFTSGSWNIPNVVPCYVSADGRYYATSASCEIGHPLPNDQVPPGPWTSNTLTVDCAGHFKLCIALKGGDVANPKPDDCTLTTQCTEADYPTPNVAQAFPDLASWVSHDEACVKRLLAGGSLYAEMTVVGTSATCDSIAVDGQPFVFHRQPYCRLGETGCVTDAGGHFDQP